MAKRSSMDGIVFITKANPLTGFILNKKTIICQSIWHRERIQKIFVAHSLTE